jgi:uncharacterized tellurite resistance protein B-like protein
MISDFLNRLLSPAPAPLSDSDARLAISALLVRVARSDGDYSNVEVINIDRVLATRYALEQGETEALRKDGEALEAEAPDTVRFTRAIKECVAYEERLAVIEALWKIALADGERDAEEDALIRLVASLLGVTDVDSAKARQKVG